MTTIKVKEIQDEKIVLEFVPYPPGLKLWIRDLNQWFSSVGWCPHPRILGGECVDCALVMDIY